jgi:hypothetical protein
MNMGKQFNGSHGSSTLHFVKLGLVAASVAVLAGLSGCVVVPARPVGVGVVAVHGHWGWSGHERIWIRE